MMIEGLIKFTDRRKGCPYGRINFSNLIATVSYHISVNFHGRSKPLPYTIGYKIHIHGSLCFNKFSNKIRAVC